MKPVTDPAILEQLNAGPKLNPVTDPAILEQLNAAAPAPQPAQPDFSYMYEKGGLSRHIPNAEHVTIKNYPALEASVKEGVNPFGEPLFTKGDVVALKASSDPVLVRKKIRQKLDSLPGYENSDISRDSRDNLIYRKSPDDPWQFVIPAQQGGQGIPTIAKLGAEVAGAIGGTFAGAPVGPHTALLTGGMGAAGARYGVEYLLMKYAESKGTELVTSEDYARIKKEATLAGLIDYGGGLTLKGLNMLKTVALPFTYGQLKTVDKYLDTKAEKNLRDIKEVQEDVGPLPKTLDQELTFAEEGYAPTLPGIVESQVLKRWEATMSGSSDISAQKLKSLYDAQDRTNHRYLIAYLENATGRTAKPDGTFVTNPVKMPQIRDKVGFAEKSGKEVQEVTGQEGLGEIAQKQAELDAVRKDYAERIEALPKDYDPAEYSKAVRTKVQAEYDLLDDIEEVSYLKLKEITQTQPNGTSAIRISRDDEFKSTGRALYQKIESKLIKMGDETTLKHIRRVYGLDAGRQPYKVDKVYRKQGGAKGRSSVEVAKLFGKEAGDMDLNQANQAIRDLNRIIRKANIVQDPNLPRISDLIKMKEDIIALRTRQLELQGRPEVSHAIREAEQSTMDKQEAYSTGFLHDVIQKHSARLGEYKMPENVIFERMYSRNDTAMADELLSVAKGDEHFMQQIRDNYYAMYWDQVYKTLPPGGFPSAKAHDAFFSRGRKDVMSRFFDKGEMAKMDKLGGFVKVIKQQEKELGNLEKAFNKAFEGKIQRWNAEEISTHFQKMSLDEVRVLNSLLKKTPAVKDAFLKSIRMDIADKIVPISAKQEAIDYKRLTTAINQNAKKFELLGEAEYLRNLRVLQNNVEMLQPGKPFGKEGQGIELRFFRLLFGALSRPQRVLTANQQRIFNERDRLQHKILTSPLALKKFLALRHKQINDEKVMVWLMAGIQDYD